MVCQELSLINFRNVTQQTVTFAPGVNVITGKNAQGKTNLLEAVFLFAIGRGFRARTDASLLRFGQSRMRLQMRFEGGGRTQQMEFALLPGTASGTLRRFCRCGGAPMTRLSEWVGRFRAVLFCPEHLALVKEGPAARRAFLDSALSQLYPAYLASLQRYHAILRQRSALLHTQRMLGGSAEDAVFVRQMEVWSEQLAREAAYLAVQRSEYAEKLGRDAADVMEAMSGGAEKLTLRAAEPLSEREYLRKLTGELSRELRMGSTQYGIHRDDLQIQLDGRDARLYASQGQQRSVSLALKLAEGERIREETGEYPVFLLDDILSELDADRRDYVLQGFGGKQILIASCEEVAGGSKRFLARQGSYTVE